MSGPRVFKHGVYSALVIGEEDGGLITYGGLPVSGGTKVVLHVASGSGAQTITAGIWGTITGWSVLEGDSGMKSGDTIKISESGKYLFGFSCGIREYSTTNRHGIRVLKNGATSVAFSQDPALLGSSNVFENPAIPVFCGNILSLSAGDTLEGQAWHSAVDLGLASPENYGHPKLWAVKVSG